MFTRRNGLLVICLIFTLPVYFSACKPVERTGSSAKRMDLYLLIGQSNMAGRGNIEAEDIITDPHVFMLNKQNKWVPAKTPLHFDKPVAGTGLGLTFGKIMAQKEGKKIGLIPCAVGGTSINKWMPGIYDKETKTFPYDEAIKRTKIALYNGQLKGILWHQGESDAVAKNIPLYKQRFDSLLINLQKDLSVNIQSIPIVVGELGAFYCEKNLYATGINTILHQIANAHRNIALVTSEGLSHKGDTVHFDSESQRELGRRYAEKMTELIDNYIDH